MTILIIAEKPSVAEDIARVLDAGKKESNFWKGNDVVVTWAIGHLLELKTPEEYDKKYHRWSLEHLPIIPENFATKPKKDKSRKEQLKAITGLLSDGSITEIVNACDAAREGELIFWEIVDYANSEIETSRMWLQSMTKSAILKAFEDRKKSSEFHGLRDAAVARAQADWIIGMTGSRAMSIRLPNEKNRRPYSIGRVQTPTLAIVVDRELEHLAHIPEPYWNINAEISVGDAVWNAKWNRGTGENPERIYKHDELMSVQSDLESGSVCEISESKKERTEFAPLNFDLTTLQKTASNLWNWPAKQVDSVAQSLYEEYKLTTYPRTDSKFLTDDMQPEVDKLVEKISKQEEYELHCNNLKSKGLSNTSRNFNSSKVGDHFAIIPTGNSPSANLPKQAKLLYDLIVRRFLSSFHDNAIWEDTKRVATVKEQNLIARASTLKDEGWRAVVPKKGTAPEGWGVLPKSNCEGKIVAIEVHEKTTKPPYRLKDGGIISAMENAGKIIEDDDAREAISEKGLGTPATRAEHIENLIRQDYVERLKGGSLRATTKGIRLIDVLRRISVDWISSPELTAEMELKLKGVQEGDVSSSQYMEEISEKITTMVELVKSYELEKLYPNEESLGDCPICQSQIYENMMNYCCEKNDRGKGCKFVVWKNSSGRHFDKLTAKRLIDDRKVENLHGFVNRSSEDYTTSIVLNDDHKIEFMSNGPSEEELSGAEKFCDCPNCESGSIKSTESHWACDNSDCKARPLSKIICKREMEKSEALKYYSDGQTDLIDDFISKKGRPFSARLVNNGGRMKFEFPPRNKAVNSNLPKYQVADGVVGMYTYRGSKIPVVESATHFITAENEQGISLEIPRTFAQRELVREECKLLIENGEVGPLDDFISKKGKPFSAKLVLNKNGDVKYRFG